MCILSTALTIGATLATTIGLSVTATGAGATAISTATATGIGLGVLGLGAAAVAGTAVGGTLSTVQAAQQADQQAMMAEQQAEIEAQNAKLAARRAERLDMEANQKRAALLREYQQTRSTGRAGYAASGVVLGSGVTLDYEADTADIFDLDLRNLEYDVKSQQWEQRVAATNNANQAALYRAQQKAYESGKSTAIAGGIMKTVGNTASAALSVGTAIGSLMPSGASAATLGSNFKPFGWGSFGG